jgi:hypothetical protein
VGVPLVLLLVVVLLLLWPVLLVVLLLLMLPPVLLELLVPPEPPLPLLQAAPAAAKMPTDTPISQKEFRMGRTPPKETSRCAVRESRWKSQPRRVKSTCPRRMRGIRALNSSGAWGRSRRSLRSRRSPHRGPKRLRGAWVS